MNTAQAAQTLSVHGIDVHLEGDGPEVVLMLHGWPDTHHLWDATVARLRGRARCARFTLPGYDLAHPPRPTSLSDMTALLAAITQAVSPDAPVTLLMHDWGCIFGYEFALRHPQRVRRIVAVDIGDYNSTAFARSLGWRERLQIAGYQIWLALAWKIGRSLSPALGNHMTRSMAAAMRCPVPAQAMGWPMNYPYAMAWLGLMGGFKGAARVAPECPVLYLYGKRKPFMFHSPQWLERLTQRPGSAAHGVNSGHWVMLDQPEAFHGLLENWLDGAA